MAELLAKLHAAGVEATADAGIRAAYSTDASLYRIPPEVVAFPRDADEVEGAYAVARELGVPLTARGAGTSVAGNSIGPGLVIDMSRHLDKVVDIDPDAAVAVVQPGVVQDVLQRAAAPFGLRFGPDPSTSTRCTIGGMIGNNACGSRTLGYGRTADNIVRLQGIFGTQTRFDLHARTDDGPASSGDSTEARALGMLVEGRLSDIRTAFGRFGRQVSGYAMEHLLPERGTDVARFLVGSEGTLGVVTQATVRLVRDPAHRVMVVLGYPDIASAGEAASAVLTHGPTACEGLDARLVDVVRERLGPQAVPALPDGAAWLFTEVSGDDRAEVLARARQMASDTSLGAQDARVVQHSEEATALWRIRSDGAGLAGRAPSGRPAHGGWEDAAVPPWRLGDYLRDFDALLDESGLSAFPYGHFADGCVHARIDLPLDRPDAGNVLRSFLNDAASLVARYGGSLSGEHGDGRARSELLPHMYSTESLDLFAAVKRICDPDNLLNPGVLVDPAPVDRDLRFPTPAVPAGKLGFAWSKDGGNLAQAFHRCTGVGKCRADNTEAGGVMCPSYLATGNEMHSTRGRARILQEMVNGSVVGGGWRSPEVHEALDLCLSCKGCASDCPTGTDMASYKAEVLYQSYKGRIRPRTHYILGRLPRWARLAGRAPKVANAMLRVGDRIPLLKTLAGVDSRRSLPQFAPVGFRRWATEHGIREFDAANVGSGQVVLFGDTFTEGFSPEVGRATVSVLRRAGYEPVLTPRTVCCGLTWITTGQLDGAKHMLTSTVSVLAPAVEAGLPIVGMEPSCTAVLRDELTELVPGNAAESVRDATVTLAELLQRTPDWRPPDLSGVQVVAQPHCHHHAIMGWSADERMLRGAGADLKRVGGCCGLAGNFGVEQGHYDISVKVAEHDLLPAVDAAPADAVILADGFSCRTQLDDLAGRKALHLAQLLDGERPA